MKICVLEDEKAISAEICGYLKRYFDEKKISVEIVAYYEAFDLIENYHADTDVLFMDVQLPVMNGMEAAGIIRKQDPQVLIVFVTNLAQYAVEGYEVKAFDFILKPVDYNGFSMKLDRICNELEHRSAGEFISVKSKEGFVRLAMADISYVEVRKHDLIFNIKNQKIVSRGALKNIAKSLENHYFSLCNSCYLVNLAYVRSANKTVVLSTGEELPISQGKRSRFMSELAKYIGGTI